MNGSAIRRASAAGALTLVFSIGSVSAAAAYSWTEILVPSIGPIGIAFGPNEKGQVAVQSADGTKSGIYRGGSYTPLPSRPAGYQVIATGINNGGTVVGVAISPSDPAHQQGFILVGSKYTFFSRAGWDDTVPRAISNSGLITGYSSPSDLSTTAGFIYDARTNTFTDATPPGSGAGFSTA